MCGMVHPNLVGHTYIADLVIGWMQSCAVSMLLDDWLSPAAAGAQESAGDVGTQVCAPNPAAPLLQICDAMLCQGKEWPSMAPHVQESDSDVVRPYAPQEQQCLCRFYCLC